MSISVIIVNWNARDYLLQCLESIRSQVVDRTVEVIVVDNASSDGSPEAVAEAFPAVKLLRNSVNAGFARANNLGIGASTGDYLFLVNSDVVVRPACFQRIADYMDATTGVGILGPRIVGADGFVQRSSMGYPSLWGTLTRALALDSLFPGVQLFGTQLQTFARDGQTREVDVVNGCFWAVRRSAMGQVGLLDERFLIYGEDVDWCRRFNQAGWKVVFFADAGALHYGGASSANAPLKFYLEMQRADFQYWQKHHSRFASASYLFIKILHHLVRLGGELGMYPWRRRNRHLALHKVRRCSAALRWVATAMALTLSGRELPEASRSL